MWDRGNAQSAATKDKNDDFLAGGGAACFSTFQGFLRFTSKSCFLLCYTSPPFTCTFSSTIPVLSLPDSVPSTSLQSPTDDNSYRT